MAKEKVKKFVNGNRKTLKFIVLALLIILLTVGMIVYGANSKDGYAVEIKDDGANNIAQDNNSTMTKKIIAETMDSLTYEVQIKNLIEDTKIPEIAIVIDSSSSMEINELTIEQKTKTKALQLVTELLEFLPKANISISSNDGIKMAMSRAELTRYADSINKITHTDDESVTTGIDYAMRTFSGSNTEKYLVIFSDATDSILDKLETATSSDVSVYSILTNITNNEYLNGGTAVGKVQRISDVDDFSSIYNNINKSLVNVKVTDVFTSEVNEYFDFEVLSKDDEIEVQKQENGYILNIPTIRASETKTIRFKLTLKDNVVIDITKTYKVLNTSDSMKMEYVNKQQETQSYEMNVSPTFVICKKYSLTIQAVSEKSSKLPVTDLEVQVVGTVIEGQDEAGNDIIKTIYNEILTTDSNGKIKIDNLKKLGDIYFEIKPLVKQIGYTETQTTQIVVHNDPTGVGTIWAEADVGEKPIVDPVERNITVILPIVVDTFNLEIITTDANNTNIALGNIEYRLIQPKLNSKYDMEAMYGVTDSEGKLTFETAIMTKDGSYQYILSQMNEQDGYESMGNVTIIVTFENGKVTHVDEKFNELVNAYKVPDVENKGIVEIGNMSLNEDTFFLNINLEDKDTKEKLFGAIYDIELTRTTVGGETLTSTYNGYITDTDGKINIEMPGTGYINLKIREKTPKAGYVPDTVVKDITFLRKNGTVQHIASKYPTSLEAIADSDNNTVIVNLNSELATEQNRIQVQLSDNDEPDAKIPGVLLAINKVGDTQIIQGITNRDGIANFIIPNETAGTYQYEISLLSAVPSGYLAPSTQLGVISLTFDDRTFINKATDVSSTIPFIEVSFEQMIEEKYKYDTAKVDIRLKPDLAKDYKLKINLLDGTQMQGMAGGKYSIQMESDGVEVKYLAGKLTDQNGDYTTRIIGDGENIIIRITQTATLPGYILTKDTQVIELERTDSGYILANSSPNVYDPENGQIRGAELIEKELIYHDVNDKKTGANTLLNLYVNKMDMNDFLVSGVKVKLSSDTLKDANGNPLDHVYPAQDDLGNPIEKNYYVTDQNGYFEVLGIKVDANDLNNGERVDYLTMNELDANGKVKDNTQIKFKITFRENKYTGVVEVTNVEATWGNRLVKQRTFSSKETDVAYESDIFLDLFTNFDDVGNFSIDLKKINKDGTILPGAKYDIIVMRPDGTTFVRKDINVADNVELDGILVSQDTKIEITEKVAPIGYLVNEYTEVINITEIDPITGIVQCELESGSYSQPRAIISNKEAIISSNGKYKLCITLDLIDYEMDTFKLGITAQDSTTTTPIKDYSFTIATSEGAQKNTPATDSNGKTMVQVGANYKIENYEVTYTINSLKVADYYKKLVHPIEVKVVFDINGEVVSSLTDEANKLQPGYGTLWSIEATNTIDGNDIDILINIDPCDPLVVNIQTVDTLNNEQVTNVEYSIVPTLNIPATGTTRVEVGYVLPKGIQTYTIKQTNANDIQNYEPIAEQQIKVTYDEEGNILALDELTQNVHEVSINGKEATITIDIEPRVPFTIKNTGFFDGLNLANGKFEISLSDTDLRKMNTDINGEDLTYIGAFGKTQSQIYTVKQTVAAYGYATVDDFQIEVFFDDNRNIVDTKILGGVNKYVEFVYVSHKTPSTAEDKGYNGNDNGIVNIIIKNYPEIQFQIENVDKRDNSIKLAGTSYKVESSINTKDEQITTGSNGIGIANLDKSGYETTVTYTISEISPAPRYQSLGISAIVEVDFNNLGYIIGTPRVVKRSDVVSASTPAIVTLQDNFKINIIIESNPVLSVTITKVDEEDPTIVLPKVDFELTARILKDNLSEFSEDEINQLTLNSVELKEEEYLSQVLDRLKINTEDIIEMKKEIAIEEFIEQLKNEDKLTAEEEDQIRAEVNNNLKISKIVSLGKATKTQMNQKVIEITNRVVLDKLIEDGTTTADRVNELIEIVKKQLRLDVDNITTNSNGIAIAYMDRTLSNKTIEYTLKETKKADGYDWLDEVVIFEITYDAEGKMIETNPVVVKSGQIDITSVDQENFALNVTVKNKTSDEVRIHLSVEDVYDSEKKLETAKFDAYLVDTENAMTYSPDNKYRVTLESGSEIGSTALTTAHGEDTEVMGIYEEGSTKKTRILRLVLKETPTSYYIGDEKFESAYQPIKYALLVSVEFNDEGSVVNVRPYSPGGNSSAIGYIADERYIQVTHTRNTINVTVRFYPMLQVQMQAVDMYTGDSLQGNYTIDTNMWGVGSFYNGIVSAGYINPYFSSNPFYDEEKEHWYSGREYYGQTYSAKYNTKDTITSIEEADKITVAPTEADFFEQNINPNKGDTRTFYIYENAEPTSPTQYQTYLPRYITHSSQYLLAKIQVKYDKLGQVEKVEVLEEKSSNNIKSGFITAVDARVNGHTIQIVVKYAPITKINATVIDEVSRAPLSGIRINPYVDGNEVTRTSYEYRTVLYYTTNKEGQTGWTYWGGSVQNAQNRYVLNSYTVGSGYEGYFDPENIILDVSYGENGRVSGVTSRNTDQFGDDNVVDITWDEYNNINVTIRYCRKFNVKLNKVDYYDSNKQLNAAFDLVSSKEARVSMAANTATTIGKIYPGKTVKYTLSETAVPTGYIPIENLDIVVEFNNNGTIRSATSTSPYYEFLSSAPLDKTTNSLKKVDLIANIKNKPRFDVSLELSDRFYPSIKLEGGTFTIENSKGEVFSGGVLTDKNGILETYVGTVHPNETVEYTVKQTNVIPGYYENNTIMKFTVHFNSNGKVEKYSLIEGTDAGTIHPEKYVGKQEIKLEVTNRPKDLRIGMYKYDELTNNIMQDVQFKITTQEEGKLATEKTLVTNADGTAIEVLDTFVESNANRVVKYTISEIQAAETYRKIQDVIIQVTYKPDGSIYLYDVLSNPSNVEVEIATNKNIKQMNETQDNTPVHIKLRIPNDNAYDLIIKNEDKNYEGLGIEGTVYDVSINGVAQKEIKTNVQGIAKIENQTQSGEIELVITERTIGEGYRADNNNTVTFKVQKGIQEYYLLLVENSNSNPTYAIVEVDEEYGTITVTFKNETKLELTMQKNDINTGEVLEGAVFEIKEEELDSSGNVIEGTEKIITTNETNTTDAEGLLYFDLGLSKQNKTIQYTFTELTPPDGYTQILPIKVIAQFDAYGHIQNMTDDSFRARPMLKTQTGKSHHMIVVIGNGTVNEEYTVKIVTEDSITGRRINGSMFQVEAIETSGVTNKSVTGVTKNTTTTIAGNTTIFEKGALRVNGITAEGNVQIKFKQIESATGYIYGSNKTSGVITINAEFDITSSSQEKEVTLELLDAAGYDVVVDNINREISIKVLNDPEVTFEITKVDGETKEPIEGVKFNITSAIVVDGQANPTDLNKEVKQTDEKGYTQVSTGYSYPGKTVVYTISEQPMLEYKELSDIIIQVQYDADGNIAEYKLLSSPNDVTILEDTQKTIRKRVLSEGGDIPGVVEIDYTNITVPTGKGTKILQMDINNYKQPSDYRIQIGKYHEDTTYPYLIPGAKYEITVTQEYGKAQTTWRDITDENGIIISPYFNGHGWIEITITEIEAPEGFILDTAPKTTRMLRYESSGKIVIHSTNAGAKLSDDYTMIYLEAVDEVIPGLYDIIVNKVDAKTGSLIGANPAQIKLELLENIETITETIDEQTGEIVEKVETVTIKTPVIDQETDEFGRIVASKLNMPTIPGEYTYILTETKAPEDYLGIAEEVELVVTFEQKEEEMIISNVVVKDAVDVKAGKSSDNVMSILVYNTLDNEGSNTLGEDEFGLDIRKVNPELYQITSGASEFTLTNISNGEVLDIATDELGRAELVRLKIPEEAGNYKYILKETKAPKGYKLFEGNINILLEFLEDDNGKIFLNKANVQGSNVVYSNKVDEGELPDRKIQLKVINEDLPYTLIIEKHHVADPYYPDFISDVEFDIKIAEEYGEELIEYTETTNSEGIIVKEGFEGYGRIRIEIKEKSAPDKYKVDYETKFIELFRDKDSKELREYDSNVNYELNEETQTIIMKPSNEIVSGIYDMVINKVDKADNTLITKNPAEFNLYMIRKYHSDGNVTEIREPIIQNEKTDELGMLVKESISLPTEAGTYVFELEEVTPPEGYEGLKEAARYEVTIEENEDGELIITNVNVTKGMENLNVLIYKDQFIALSVINQNTLPENKLAFEITKVDEDNNIITTDTAVFKLIDNQTNKVYYAETDTNAVAELIIDKAETAGTYTYTLNEIKAPEGYALDRSDINVSLEYLESESGKVYLGKVNVSGNNVTYNATADGELPSNRIQMRVTNVVGSNGNANDKPYTIVINKRDSQTKEMILDSVTFDVSLANGEIAHAGTNVNGQIIIENIHMPSEPGEYEIVVKELTTPKHYEEDKEMKIVKVTFTGYGEDMVISNIELDGIYNKNIEIVTEECTEDKVTLNVLNVRGNPELYVVSKQDANEKDIYEVQGQGFEGRHYTIKEAYIDTKVAKYGSNMTVQEFIDNLESNGVMTVLDKDGNELSSTDRVKTGMTLRARLDTQELRFTIIVKGDYDGDGRVRTKDLDGLIKHMSNERVVTDPIALRALDLIDNDEGGRIRTTDLNEFYKVLAQ